LRINNSFHDNPFVGQFMVAITELGREAFWTVATALIFIFGGMTGKKTATIIALTKAYTTILYFRAIQFESS